MNAMTNTAPAPAIALSSAGFAAAPRTVATRGRRLAWREGLAAGFEILDDYAVIEIATVIAVAAASGVLLLASLGVHLA
jgi:hypothetical protein